jgi:hypothetical protein
MIAAADPIVTVKSVKSVLRWLHPSPTEPDARRIAGLVVLAGAASALGASALILVWWISGDLQAETAAAGFVLLILLAGLVALAFRRRERAALWILSGLLFLLVAGDLAAYGVHSSMTAAFLLPILLIGDGFGARAGVLAAAACSGWVWFLAAAENGGWFALPYPADSSHLTFDAPALTVVYLFSAAVAGYAAMGRPAARREDL